MKKIEQLLKTFLLNILLTIKSKKYSNTNRKNHAYKKILLIRLNRIGDALVTTPLISFLKQNLNCEITILADQKNFFIFKNSLGVDNVIIFRKGLLSFLNLLKELNSKNYDVVIDLHDDVSTTVTYLISLLNIREKVGLKKYNYKIFTHTIEKLDSKKNHIVLRIMSLVKFFGLNYDPSEINITYQADRKNTEEARDFVFEKFNNRKFLVGINISAGSDARFWGTDRYKKLLQFLKNYDVNILLLSSEQDLNKIQEISSNNYVNFYSRDFDKFTAVISQLDLLFTPDTSVVHIASVYEVPVFGLYVKYNTTDIIWSPYKSKFECVITEEATLENVTFDLVIHKFKPFFERILNAKRNSRL